MVLQSNNFTVSLFKSALQPFGSDLILNLKESCLKVYSENKYFKDVLGGKISHRPLFVSELFHIEQVI